MGDDKGQVPGYFIPAEASPSGRLLQTTEVSLLSTLRSGWWIILVAILLGGALAVFIALTSDRIYQASVLLAPAEENSGGGLSGLTSQLGGVGMLLGGGLGGSTSLRDRALATLRSRGFGARFIEEQQMLPVLYADRWDQAAADWRPGVSQPTVDDGVEVLERNLRTISEDRQTGITTLSIRWTDPELAAVWANGMVDLLNRSLQQKAIQEFNRNVEYLNREMAQTSVVEIRDSLANLMEEQLKSAMIANVSNEYAFRVLDRAVPADPKRPVRPRSALLVAIGLVAGALLGAAIVWIRVLIGTSGRTEAP